MHVFTDIKQICQFPNVVIALGTFDGVHVGHQKIIGRAVELARNNGGTSVVFTFTNHPLSIIAPERCPPQINTPTDKAKLIASLGVDVLITIPFTETFLKLSPLEFINLLVSSLTPSYIIAGPNYSFGYKSAGTPDLLKELAYKYGFKAEIQETVFMGNKIISSTYIRNLIATGDVKKAKQFLGRSPFIIGKVISGDARGRTLGYPTANLELDKTLVTPSDGVYAVHVNLAGIDYKALANIGYNPTFSNTDRRLEVFILDFQGNLYGEELTVSFLGRLRDEIAFTNLDALKTQIAKDIIEAKSSYFG